jgi:hypothetical protein
MSKIFVNLCSYRDKFLPSTLESLMATESGRNEIVYGVFDQSKLDTSLIQTHPNLANHSRVRYKRIDPEYSDGVVWARSINAMQVENEEFQYQIDSHMLFDDAWDNYLIFDYNQAKKIANTDKVILTAGTKNFKLVGENNIIKSTFDGEITTNIKYVNFDKNLRLNAHGHWVKATEQVQPSLHILAGNFFTHIDWIKNVGYNTKIYFHGEEQMLTLSSWLAGYKIFNQRSIKVYHYINSSNHESKATINPVISQEKIAAFEERTNKELSKYIYSIDEETLKNYKEETGIDYINRKLESRAVSEYWKFGPEDKKEWEVIPLKEKIDDNKEC